MGSIQEGMKVMPIRPRGTAPQRDLDSLAAVPALARAIDAHRPDILFSAGNHTHLHAALALRGAGRRKRVRFIGRSSNAVVSAGPARWRDAALPVERFQFRAMDRIVAVSEELAAALEDRIGVDRGRIRVVPNGVDVARIRAAVAIPINHRFFAPGSPPVILGIGRLSRQKNFEGLVRAFAAARERRPMRLLILGSGSEARRRDLYRIAARSGVEEDFALEGFVDNPFAYLARAGLFVLNSRWEGASNALLEALACGCPVVATRAPAGIIEVMLDGRIGPLVPVGDDDALASAMLARLAQPRASEALRARAADYDLGRTLAAYAGILDEELRCARA